eukprot:15296810-Alexandrium_andersonii.AAC.1
MSASLVGSEMCIRDRCGPSCRNAATSSRRERAVGAAHRGEGQAAKNRACLLYTSDAADDM